MRVFNNYYGDLYGSGNGNIDGYNSYDGSGYGDGDYFGDGYGDSYVLAGEHPIRGNSVYEKEYYKYSVELIQYWK